MIFSIDDIINAEIVEHDNTYCELIIEVSGEDEPLTILFYSSLDDAIQTAHGLLLRDINIREENMEDL